MSYFESIFKCMCRFFCVCIFWAFGCMFYSMARNASIPQKQIVLSGKALEVLSGKKILYIERKQYPGDHHNTETLFMAGEFNENSFSGGSAMRIFDVDTRFSYTLLECVDGVIRDPEISYDGSKVIFSMRKNLKDSYHIYEMNLDGTGMVQLTKAENVSDIDPTYLPDGSIVFSSTRQPKYCMCNLIIQANLFRMNGDGSNITQIGVNTLFEGHASVLDDGRILYDRWEYVDRNFGDAQGLWTVNPDGTKHSIYYGNNTACPGGVIDGRQIPGTDLVVCIFAPCHERPWGAMTIIDRKKGVDGKKAVVQIWPKEALDLVDNGDLDTFKGLNRFFEDPFPIDKENFLVSRTIWYKPGGWFIADSKQGIYLVGYDGTEELLIEGNESLFDPQIIQSRQKPNILPFMRNFRDSFGQFYVENVYEGTHMKGVEKGVVKWLRVVESPEKRTWSKSAWSGQGAQYPGMNWHSFENKQILGEVPVEEDGSVSFYAPSKKHVYFQLLDKDKKMIQSMRSGVSLMPGEINGCVGCHEDRLSIPTPAPKRPLALQKKPRTLMKWQNKEPFKFSFMEHVQPILDKHCVKCHDFDINNRKKLVLAKDKTPFFNTAYTNLYVNKIVNLVGGGPAEIQQAYSWGSHASKLTKIIDNGHKGVKLSAKEKEIMYTWMDLNGVYYPVYESSFFDTLSGRCPLYDNEIQRLAELTGINLFDLRDWRRSLQAQISFDRPDKSIILDKIRKDKSKYNEALQIIKLGQKRLKEMPRGDIESQLVPCVQHKEQLKRYIKRVSQNKEFDDAINSGRRLYDIE